MKDTTVCGCRVSKIVVYWLLLHRIVHISLVIVIICRRSYSLTVTLQNFELTKMGAKWSLLILLI